MTASEWNKQLVLCPRNHLEGWCAFQSALEKGTHCLHSLTWDVWRFSGVWRHKANQVTVFLKLLEQARFKLTTSNCQKTS